MYFSAIPGLGRLCGPAVVRENGGTYLAIESIGRPSLNFLRVLETAGKHARRHHQLNLKLSFSAGKTFACHARGRRIESVRRPQVILARVNSRPPE